MSTKIFCDIADYKIIKNFSKKKIVKGFTTNPSLMRKAGAKDYKSYCMKILKACKNKPVSFEVFGDNYKSMMQQALTINTWGKNVYVKVPIVNSKGKFTGKIINHFQLPYGTPEELVKKIPKLEEDEVIFLTLPTPKQEQVANLLSKLNNHFKILCVGGALNMLGGDEKTVPPLIYSLNLESLWRLKYEPYRRTSRLFESLYYYILSEFNGKYNNIKEKN